MFAQGWGGVKIPCSVWCVFVGGENEEIIFVYMQKKAIFLICPLRPGGREAQVDMSAKNVSFFGRLPLVAPKLSSEVHRIEKNY